MSVLMQRFFIVFALLTSSLFADILLEGKSQSRELLGVPFYEDKEGKLSFQEIVQKEFTPNAQKVASFGFSTSVYWFKIDLAAHQDAGEFKWRLNVAYPLLDKVDLYICDEEGSLLALKKSGKARPFNMREIKEPNFIFPIDPLEKQMLYLRVDTQSSIQVPLYLQSSQSLFSEHGYLLILSGIYYGIFILLFFYNLVTFVQMRSRKYFFYLLFIGSFALWQLSLDGLGIVLLWSDFNWMIMHGSGAIIGLMIVSLILFSREILKTELLVPKIDIFVLLLALLVSVLTLAAFFRPYAELITIMAAVALVLPPLLLALGIIAYTKKFSPARFYSAGMALFLLAGTLLVMNKFGWIEGFYFFSYAQQIGSALGMLFLSWALADLLKESERETLEKANVLNRLLEDKLHKCNTQMQRHNHVLIEKSRLAAMGEKIEQIAHQWRQPLHALALINQNLYFKTQLDTVTKEDYEEVHDKMNEQLQYMSQTIDDFRNFSKSNKKKEAFIIETVIKSAISLSEGSLENAKVKTQLLSEGEHTAYGMCHELMQVFMSLIKNAHDVILEKNIQAPWINFIVADKESQIEIRVEDNGGGISADVIKRIFQPYFSTKQASGGSGIGLYMSKEIIEKSMLGRISVSNSEVGAVFSILLPKTTKKVAK